MEELYKMQQSDLGAKALVFSQFCNMLDLLEFRIERGGIKTGKLQGHMNITQRDAIIKDFKENPDTKVLLISLKAGGVALNLTVASHVSLLSNTNIIIITNNNLLFLDIYHRPMVESSR